MGNHICLTVNLTISMAMFNSYVQLPESNWISTHFEVEFMSIIIHKETSDVPAIKKDLMMTHYQLVPGGPHVKHTKTTMETIHFCGVRSSRAASKVRNTAKRLKRT